MGKTNSLRMLVGKMLKQVCTNVFYEVADETVENDDGNKKPFYPHIVYLFNPIDLGDVSRQDYIIDIDIWDRGPSAKEIEDMADAVEQLFNARNVPQEDILPTFWLVDRQAPPDEDKNIRHRLVKVQVQNYERRG